MRGWIGGVRESVIMDELRLIAETASLRVKKLSHLKNVEMLNCLHHVCIRYLLQAIGHRFKFMINFLHCKVNMKFEVQPQVNFVAFFVWNQLSVIPYL